MACGENDRNYFTQKRRLWAKLRKTETRYKTKIK